MEKQSHSEMELNPSSSHSHLKLLKVHRELLVTQIRNTQCLVDNLLENGYFSVEDAEIVCACPTKPNKVRRILDMVQSKGEEVAEFFLYVLQQLTDAYVDLRPWLADVGFMPSPLVQSRTIVNTDPVSRYTQKLRHQLGCDSKFMLCYGKQEEMLLEETYTDTIMELVSFSNESLGNLDGPACLLDPSTGILNEQGETVFIFGDAGVGKSMLLQRLQHLWASGQLDSGVKFFFHFRCRTFSCFRESDRLRLQDLLFKHYCYPEHDPCEVFAFLLRFPQTALFTFDGLDELHSDFDLSRAPDSCCPWEPAHPLVLLANLLSGRLLKGAGKLLTARTGVELPRQLLRKKVLLRGFSPGHLRAYARRMIPERVAQCRLLEQLEANPNLCSLCAVPLFCWIIFRCFQHFHASPDGGGSSSQLPDQAVTLTDVFLLVAEMHLNKMQPRSLVQRNTRSPVETFLAGRRSLLALGRLAHGGMAKGLFVFSQEQAQTCALQKEDLQLGFLRAAPEPGPEGEGGPPSYEFFHITLQAFLTAFFLVVDDQVDTQELLAFFQEWAPPGEAAAAFSCYPRFLAFQRLGSGSPVRTDPFQKKDHLQFTNLFLCGLLSKAKQKLLQHLVPPTSLRRKRKALWAHLFASVRTYLKNLPRVQSGGFNQVQAMPTFLWMLRCIYETQSQEVGQLAARGMCANYLKLTYCNACSADCSALSFVLHHFRKRLALDLDNNNLNDYGVRELQPCFSRLTVVRLSVNQITDSGVKVLAEELTKYKILTYLGLYSNQITDVGAQYVAKVLDECRSLTHLKLGKNKITSEGGKYLALAVKNSSSIIDVGMWGNQIGDEGAKAFAEALRNHPSLRNLSLAFNGITMEGGKSLAQALCCNTSLRIFWLTKNELNDEAAASMAEMLKVNQTLQNLWLIQNQITAKGTAQLAEALQRNTGILEICLNGNPIEPEEAEAFAKEKRIICF